MAKRVNQVILGVEYAENISARRLNFLALMVEYKDKRPAMSEPTQFYCTLREVLQDIDEPGVKYEGNAMSYIKAASQFIQQKFGRHAYFIPVTATVNQDGNGEADLLLDWPLISLTSLTMDGTAIASTQYIEYPQNRHWPNGPYTRLGVDDDATALSVWKDERDCIVMVGKWGLYEAITGQLTTQNGALNDEDETLVVLNGSEVGPGAVVLLDSEQMAITATGAATDSTTNTNEAVDIIEEEIDVVNGALLNMGEIIRIDFEQMRVIDISGNTISVERGYNYTKKAAHNTATDVYVYRTFTVQRGANGTTAASHTNAAVYRYMPPGDINWLCRQMVGLMIKKAKSGFAGKIGSAELGEVFYQNEFPNDPLNKIKANYRLTRIG